MLFNRPIKVVIVLQAGLILAFLLMRFDQKCPSCRDYYEIPTISWMVLFLLTIVLPFVFSRFFIFKRANKKRITLLFISVLTVETAFAVISPSLYGGGNTDFQYGDFLKVGVYFGLPIAGLSLISTSQISFQLYNRVPTGDRS